MKARHWLWRQWEWVGCILLMVYVLSVGPACKFCLDYHRRVWPVLFVYRPIWEIARLATPGRALTAYLCYWGTTWRAEYRGFDQGVLLMGRENWKRGQTKPAK